MATSYKFWCRLCGDLRSEAIDDEMLLDLIQKNINIPATHPLYICTDCNAQLTNFSMLIKRAIKVNEMFQGLDEEDENDLCIRRLNAYRAHFEMSTMIEFDATSSTKSEIKDENEEIYELIEDIQSSNPIEDSSTIVEEILVETVEEDDSEIVEEIVCENLEDERTFMYHMTDSNKLLKLFSFKCHLCPQPEYPNMRLLTEHCQVVHNSQPSVRCCSSECGKMLQTWRRLMIHKEKHFPSEEAMTCDICHTVFATKVGFDNHKKTHTRQFICSYCAKTFSEQKTLKFHEETHRTPLDARRSFACPHCHLKFITKQACQNHISMKHEKVVTVTCPVPDCGKGFFTRKAMLEHQRMHREKTFKCSECDFMSKTKSQLNAHAERHNVKKSECEMCGLIFENASKLKNHVATH